MFTRLPNGDLQVSVRPPLIYLDHCAIRGISSDAKKRDHLRETFQTRGTLMFSVVNRLEMGRNTGASYERIRDLLDSLGPYWVPSDPDPGSVLKKEMEGALAPESFFPPLEIFGHIFRSFPEGTFTKTRLPEGNARPGRSSARDAAHKRRDLPPAFSHSVMHWRVDPQGRPQSIQFAHQGADPGS